MAGAAVEMLFAGIQAAGGAALAFYTYKKSPNSIWPIACSGVALTGACNVFRSVIKIFQNYPSDGKDESSTVRNVVTGSLIYFGGLYGFSEAWKCNDKLWITCLGTAASGFYFAVSSMNSFRTSLRKLHLKFCQLAFEPALSVCGTIFLLYFRNHEDECQFWVPLSAIGFKIATSGFTRLMQYVGLKRKVARCFTAMMIGHILFFSGCLIVKYTEHVTARLMCLLLAGCGHCAILASIHDLYILVPRPVFIRYCQRVWGPLLTLYSSAASAYIGYHMGWRFSLPTMALVPAGLYITYKRFRRMDENLPKTCTIGNRISQSFVFLLS